jgi:hypothetical protein
MRQNFVSYKVAAVIPAFAGRLRANRSITDRLAIRATLQRQCFQQYADKDTIGRGTPAAFAKVIERLRERDLLELESGAATKSAGSELCD